MQSFQFQTVSRIISGLNSIQQLNDVLHELDAHRILVITDAGIVQLNLHSKLLEILQRSTKIALLYAQVQADPSEHMIHDAVNFARQEKIDAVIGFGGGSALDVAKMVALLSHPQQKRSLDECYGLNQAQGPKHPLILIPTTAGTGSEVTPISIITTSDFQKKGVVSPHLYADIVILDGLFTLDLPQAITAATGIDAMVHAIEAYTSKIKKNFYSDVLAKTALKLLNDNLYLVLQNGHNAEARQNMLMGSMLAGQAFANAPVGAVHALAYPLGGHFHIPHGHSNALVLTAVMKFNASEAQHHYAELMTLLDPKSKGCTAGLTDLFIDHFQNHLDRSGLILSLNELNIPKDTLPQLAEDAMQQTRLLQNNPKTMQYTDALSIYQSIY